MANFLTDDEFLGKSAQPSKSDSKFLSDEEFLGGKPTGPSKAMSVHALGISETAPSGRSAGDLLLEGVKAPLKLGAWAAGQVPAFIASGLMGLGSKLSGGDAHQVSQRMAFPGELLEQHLGSGTTQALGEAIHTGSEALGSAAVGGQQLGEIAARSLGAPPQTEQDRLMQEAATRTAGEAIIPAAMGLTAVGPLRSAGRAHAQAQVDAVRQRLNAPENRPDLEPRRPQGPGPIDYVPEEIFMRDAEAAPFPQTFGGVASAFSGGGRDLTAAQRSKILTQPPIEYSEAPGAALTNEQIYSRGNLPPRRGGGPIDPPPGGGGGFPGLEQSGRAGPVTYGAYGRPQFPDNPQGRGVLELVPKEEPAPRGLDYWRSVLEDQVLFYEKVANDSIARRLDERIRAGETLQKSKDGKSSTRIDELLRERIAKIYQETHSYLDPSGSLEKTMRPDLGDPYRPTWPEAPSEAPKSVGTFRVLPDSSKILEPRLDPIAESAGKRIPTRTSKGLDVVMEVTDEVKVPYEYPGKPDKAEMLRAAMPVKPGDFNVIVRDTDGNVVGVGQYSRTGDGNKVVARNIETDPAQQGRGVATALERHVADMGFDVVPSGNTTAAGAAFRAKQQSRLNAGLPVDQMLESAKAGLGWLRNQVTDWTSLAKGSEGSFIRGMESKFGRGKFTEAELKALYQHAKQEQEISRTSQTARQAKTPDAGQVDAGRLSADGSPTDARAARVIERFGSWDRRTGEQLKADLAADTALQDIPDGLISKADRLISQGQHYSRKHPILKWAYDRLDWAEREINSTVNSILYGDKFASQTFNPFKGRFSAVRLAQRDADPGSMMYGYSRLKSREQVELANFADKYNGKLEPGEVQFREAGFSPAMIEAYQNLRKGFDRFWDDVLVPAAAKIGQELPAKIPGYFPASWFGEYRVWGKTAAGERVWVQAVDSVWQAKHAVDELTKKFEGTGVKFDRQDITNTRQEYTADPSAFVDAIRLLGRTSEEGKAMAAAFQEISAAAGWSKHRLARNEERIGGAAGTVAEGRNFSPSHFGRPQQLVNFERSIKNYINTGVRYAKNRELRQDMDKALRDPAVFDRFGRAVNLADSLIESYMGADKFIDSHLKDLANDIGLSSDAPKNMIAHGASMVMYLKVMMLRAPFYLAQSLQSVMAMPRILEAKAGGLKGDFAKSELLALMDFLFDYGHRKGDLEWAVKNQIIEPRFSEQLLGMSSRVDRLSPMDIWNTVTLNKVSAILDQSSRYHAFLQFLNFAESAGLKGNAAREFAGRNALDTMVEYEQWKRSPLFREMGTVGGTFSPLTTFTNNLLNRFQEYAGAIPRDKSVTALAGLMGTYLLLAGLYGLPFSRDYDNVINWINEKYDQDLPTWGNWLAKKADKVPDAVMFGVPSAATGQNLAGTLGSPEILGSLVPGFGDPVPRMAGEMTSSLGTLVGKGQDVTDAERMAALKAFAPTAPGHGMIENAFAPENTQGALGALPQNTPRTVPNAKMEGGYVRSPSEQVGRMAGIKSLDETKFDLRHRQLKITEAKHERRRARATTNMADDIMAGRSITDRDLDRWAKAGGSDSKALLEQLQNEVQTRVLDFVTRKYGADMKSPEAMRRLQLMEEFNLRSARKTEGSGFGIQRQGMQDQRGNEFKENPDMLLKQMRQSLRMEDMHRDTLRKTAERYFPGDVRKQVEWLKRVLENDKTTGKVRNQKLREMGDRTYNRHLYDGPQS